MFSIRWVQIFLLLLAIGLLAVLVNFGYFGFIKTAGLALSQPVVRTVAGATIAARDFFYSLVTIQAQVRERQGLSDQVARLQSENAQLQQESEDNEHLRQLLGLKSSLKFSTVAARLVSRDPTGISGTVVIDRGRDAGVSPGDAVLDEFGSLLGIVHEVDAVSAKFLLVTDGLIKIDARVQERNALGVVAGSHSVGLSLDLISQDIKLSSGDKIVTSGLTGLLPPGVLIGYVDEQQGSGSELFQKASVMPAAKIKDFTFVLVVTAF